MRVMSAAVMLVVENDAGKREELILLNHVMADDDDIKVEQTNGYQTVDKPYGRTDFVKNGSKSVTISIKKK